MREVRERSDIWRASEYAGNDESVNLLHLCGFTYLRDLHLIISVGAQCEKVWDRSGSLYMIVNNLYYII